MVFASLIVAFSALLFTVFSFWWVHARRGRVLGFAPHSFAGYLAPNSMRLRLPLSLFNTGAAPIVVRDLQLRLRPAPGVELVLPAQTFRKYLRPDKDDVDDFTHPWSIVGRTVSTKHVEFGKQELNPIDLLTSKPMPAIVEGLLDRDDRRVELVSFELHVEIMAHVGRYITYSNQPHVWPAGLLDKAVLSHGELRHQLLDYAGESGSSRN